MKTMNQQFDPNKKTYELLIKEYEIGAIRYENIYKAIWQNFSYMSFLSAGILILAAKMDYPSLQSLFSAFSLCYFGILPHINQWIFTENVRH